MTNRSLNILFGIAGVIAAIVAVLTYFHLQPKDSGAVDDAKVSVTSNNQSGGITANTVNIGPPDRTLNGPLKAQILSDIPRTKPISVVALASDPESYRFATELHAFLEANGFKLTEGPISQGFFVPPIVGLKVNDRGDHFELSVGSKQ